MQSHLSKSFIRGLSCIFFPFLVKTRRRGFCKEPELRAAGKIIGDAINYIGFELEYINIHHSVLLYREIPKL